MIVITVIEEGITVSNINARISITAAYSIRVSVPSQNAKAEQVIES
jgi:hypothetical protein